MVVKYLPEVDGLSKFGDYSPVAIADGVVAIAGQFGLDTTDPASQVRGAFANVGKALEAAGLGFDDVIKFNTYVVGRETIPHFMETRKEVFAEIYPGGIYPPNTLLIVAGLVHEEFVVEIEAIAQKDPAAS
ncbi:RidA family protein [Paenarthrobacter sp. NCHU4564]|uniref:RidA family protein n=1 Tax=Paenarthrobacter sp. NCHU4564 TaxID=3451353 RepID=UPI003F9A963A